MPNFSTDLEYIIEDNLILFDEESFDKYAIDTHLEEKGLENQQIFKAMNGKSYRNLLPLEEEDSINEMFEFQSFNDDITQEFGSPLYDPSFSSIPIILSEDTSRTLTLTCSEKWDSISNDSSSNKILQFYGLQCQNTNSVDNFVADIVSEVQDSETKNEKLSSRIDPYSGKMKQLKIVLERIDTKNKPYIGKENLSNRKKLGTGIGKAKKGQRNDSKNKSLGKEKLSNRKKLGTRIGKAKKGRDVDGTINKCSRKFKELKIVLKRIDSNNKPFIDKENFSNSKKLGLCRGKAKKSCKINRSLRKFKELRILLQRIDSQNKPFIAKANLSKSKKSGQLKQNMKKGLGQEVNGKINQCTRKFKELRIVLERIDSKYKPTIFKENLSNDKKLGSRVGKIKKGCDQVIDDRIYRCSRKFEEIKSKGREMVVDKEYFDLPYGWTKEVVTTRNQLNMKGKTRADIYLFSPGTKKKLNSDAQLMKFLEENPTIQCDLDVTSTKKMKHLLMIESIYKKSLKKMFKAHMKKRI